MNIFKLINLLNKRVMALEKKVADLEAQVQSQQKVKSYNPNTMLGKPLTH